MNYAILRLEKRSLIQARAMAKHALRDMAVPNADPAKKAANTIIGPDTVDGVMSLLRGRTDPLATRKDAVRVVELFIGGSPEKMHAMDRVQQDEYFARAYKWAVKKFGGRDNIVFAAVHRDESTPHMQILLTPIVDDKLVANKIIGGPAGLVKMQTEFASQVGAKFDMRRGEEGSRAKHTSVRSFYGAIERAGSIDALPKRMPVPSAPAPLKVFASRDVKLNFEKVTQDRKTAMDHNAKVQRQIEELARLSLATHGRARRKLPERMSRVDELEQRFTLAETVKAEFEARAQLERVPPQVSAEVVGSAMRRLEADALPKPHVDQKPGSEAPKNARRGRSGPKL